MQGRSVFVAKRLTRLDPPIFMTFEPGGDRPMPGASRSIDEHLTIGFYSEYYTLRTQAGSAMR